MRIPLDRLAGGLTLSYICKAHPSCKTLATHMFIDNSMNLVPTCEEHSRQFEGSEMLYTSQPLQRDEMMSLLTTFTLPAESLVETAELDGMAFMAGVMVRYAPSKAGRTFTVSFSCRG